MLDDKTIIAVEGIDGAGTTTIVEDLFQNLDSDDFLTTHEPFMPTYDEMINESIEYGIPLETFYVFQADRAEHMNHLSQQEESVVISDRYIHSTIAYQQELLEDYVADPLPFIEAAMLPFPEPEVVIFADADPETALGRIEGDDKYEDLDFLQNVYRNYKDYLEYDYQGDLIVLDTEKQYDVDFLLGQLQVHGVE